VPISFPIVEELFTPCLSIETSIFVLKLTDFYELLPNFSGMPVLHPNITYWL